MVSKKDCRWFPVFCKRMGTDVGQTFYISDILGDMKKEYRKLHSLIKKSQNILILTHKGPDFDAFASGLILKKSTDEVGRPWFPLADEVSLS